MCVAQQTVRPILGKNKTSPWATWNGGFQLRRCYRLDICVLPEYTGFVCAQSLSCVRLFATPWTVAHQVPLPMGFSRQAYGSGLPFPPPRDLPDPGAEPASPALQVDSLPPEPPGKPKNVHAEPLIFNTMVLVAGIWGGN